MTHIILAFLIASVFLKKEKLSIILAGALLPDIYYKMGYILRYFASENLVLGLSASHTFIGALLLCLIVAPIFKERFGKTAGLLYLGALSHILLDIIQTPGIYMLLWPFSLQFFSFNLVWVESFLPLITASLILAAYLLFLNRSRVSDYIKGG